LPGFTLERREDGSLLQLARRVLIVAALSRCACPEPRYRTSARSRLD
jgi:hypothetical protein